MRPGQYKHQEAPSCPHPAPCWPHPLRLPPTSIHWPWDCMSSTTQGSDLLSVSRSSRCLQLTRSSTLETQVAETTPREDWDARSGISFILAEGGMGGVLARRSRWWDGQAEECGFKIWTCRQRVSGAVMGGDRRQRQPREELWDGGSFQPGSSKLRGVQPLRGGRQGTSR